MKTCDKATYKLYDALSGCPDEQLRYNKVKEAIAEGAQLQDNDTSFGTPLIYAIYNERSLDIIKLLVDAGGVDLNYEIYGWYNIIFSEQTGICNYTDVVVDKNQEFHFDDICFIGKQTLYNILLIKYLFAINDHYKIMNIINIHSKHCTKNYPEEFREYKCIPYDTICINEEKYKYVCDICNIIGFDVNIFKNKEFEMIENIFDRDLVPDNEYPYNIYD